MEKIKTLTLKRETVKNMNVRTGVKTGPFNYNTTLMTAGQSSGPHSSSLATSVSGYFGFGGG